MEDQFSFGDIIPIIKKNLKLLIGVGVLAAILSAVFSGPSFIVPRYKSVATVYPSNITSYAKETRTEQLIQLLQSSDIRDSVIAKFDLYRRYQITPNKPGSKFQVNRMYGEFVVINKTKFESVDISVEDQSPDTAYLMVKEIMKQLDFKARKLQREKSQEIVAMTHQQIANYQHHLDTVEERLNFLRAEYGLLDYEAQTQEVTQGYFRMAAAGKTGGASLEKANKILEGLSKFGGEFQRLSVLKELGEEELANLYNRNQMAYNDINKELTYLNEVVSPQIADKKSYPVRWLMVFTSVFCTVLFTLILLLLLNSSKKP